MIFGVKFTVHERWFRRWQSISHYLNRCWSKSMMPYGTGGFPSQRIRNYQRHEGAEWRKYTSIDWARVGGFWPSHDLKQFFIKFNWTLKNKFYSQCNQNSCELVFMLENQFEKIVCRMLTILSWPHCFKIVLTYRVASSISISAVHGIFT